MSEPVFPTGGDGIHPMLGRTTLMNEVWGALTKATPSNLSVIGPRWIGKTVLLKAVADRATEDELSPYSLVVHWHLGHVCPSTNDEFLSGLCKQLHAVMQESTKDYSDYQPYLKKETYSHLKEITDLLDESEEPILMLWDGLDKPLGQENLTGTLWDQMRDIVYGKKHKIVTATRQPLDLLITNEDAITSEFWNIFDNVYIRPFSDDDQDMLVEKARVTMTSGGRTELRNWAAGHPRLLLELLNRLAVGNFNAPIDNNSVVEAATALARETSGWLRSLWKYCPEPAQEAYRALLDNGEATVQEIGSQTTECLKDHGFATSHKNRVKPSCHMMREHLQSTSGDAGSLARLFKTPESFRSNIGDVLRIRLEQVSQIDGDLVRWVSQSVMGMPDHPGDCLTNLTDIRDKALDLVMTHEFGVSLEVPNDLLEYWKYQIQRDNKVVSELSGQDIPRVPNSRAMQVGLLQLLVGGGDNLECKAKSVTKDTYTMISALHDLRNRKQHADGQPVSESVAMATIMTCLALLDCLARELQ